MAEATLSVPRSEGLQAVGDYLGYGRNQFIWTRDQTAQVTRVFRSGERQYYSPPAIGNSMPHRWSFLRQTLALDIDANTADYDLPDDFGGFPSSFLAFSNDDNQWWPVQICGVDELLRMRQLESLVLAIQPTHAAPSVKTVDQTTGQRWSLGIFPTPAVDGTLRAPYFSTNNASTDAAPYPLGGEFHAETYMAALLAAAELERTKQFGPQRQMFLERLTASIAHDRLTGPKTFGMNGDGDAWEDFASAYIGASPLRYNGNVL